MAKKPIDDNEEEDLSDFDFSDDLDDDFDLFENDDFFDEEDEQDDQETEDEEESFLENEKEKIDQKQTSKIESNQNPIDHPLPSQEFNKKDDIKPVSTVIEKEVISPDELPVTLSMEIGRVELPVSQLLQLEPGNLLELNSLPLNAIDLSVNGKIVGKGELIRIGDILGIRVIQLG